MSNLKMMKPDFFIVGSGRSGTSLFKTLLSRGGDFDVPDESSFVVRAYLRLGRKYSFGEDDYSYAARIFSRWSIDSWGLDPQEIFEALSACKPQSFVEINETIYGLYYRKLKKIPEKWGIKQPSMILQLKRLTKIYPATPIIHIVRDVRDTYLSFKAVHERTDVAPFGPKHYITTSLYWRWGIKCFQSLPEHIRKEIKYEDMITRPKECINDVYKYFSVALNPNLDLGVYSSALPTSDHSVNSHLLRSIHAKLRDPVDPNNQSKYQKGMKSYQIFIVELLCGDLLKKYGYVLMYPYFGSYLFNPIRYVCDLLTGIFYQLRYLLRDYKVSKS